MSVEPFRFAATDTALDDLRLRLQLTRWPEVLDPYSYADGFALAPLRELCAYWQTHFDWRATERELAALPHFRFVSRDGAGIHFLHWRGRGPAPLPLVLTHGWPGSFLEFLTLAPRLADPGHFGADPDDAFDVVVPSLPGFGFSDRPRQPGCNLFHIAGLWAELMSALGYGRFAAQGGDFGASVATLLALRHPQRIIGIHLNYIPGSYRPDLTPPAPPLSPEEEAFLADAAVWSEREGAYAHLQRTFPQTAAFAQHDSPAGLAAWILEKFRAWGDCGGDLESCFSRDWLLANVTLYWLTQTWFSAARLYRETALAPLHFAAGERISVPCAVARFPREAPFPPRAWVERGYRIERWSEMPRGGHFAALEQPDALAADLRRFFRGLR